MLAKERADLGLHRLHDAVMDGAGLMRALAADPVLRAIPVVVMSSMPEAAVAERCSDYVSFMRKPFKIADVIEVAARLVNHAKS